MTEVDEAELGGQGSASTLELFFDLVFVFTITQLTHSFSVNPTWESAGEVALIFTITWWIYSGYVWLTNEIAPSTTSRRTALMVAMFGFFIIALAVPDAVGGDGLVFGWAFLGVTLIHAILFRVSGGPSSAKAVMEVLPINLGAAVFVIAGGYASAPWSYALWAGAVVILAIGPLRRSRTSGFVVRPAHYSERHGGVLIIAIGESIVAVGVGLAEMPMDLEFFVEVGLGLALCYVLWWSFFGVDDEHGRHALESFPVADRNRPAVLAYGYGFVPMLLGIVFTAAGLGMTISHSDNRASWVAAIALSGGVALYMVGQASFRIVLRLPRPWIRLIAAVIAAATIPIGVYGAVWMQLVGILVFVYSVIIVDDVIAVRAGDHGQYL